MACSDGIVTDNGSCRARLTFPPDFLGFQGHFPGNPILPGVVLVEAVLGVVEGAYGKPLRLQRIASAKFREPVRPGQTIAIDCSSSGDERSLRIDARVSAAGGRVADLVLHVTKS